MDLCSSSFRLSAQTRRKFWSVSFCQKAVTMAPPPGPYSGKSTLALVARVSAFTFGLAYGSVKLKILKAKAKSHKKAEAKGHH